MTKGITVKRHFQVQQQQRGRKAIRPSDPKKSDAAPSIPRIARMMALAIRFDQLLRDGIVADQAELARLGHVSRARVTQFMNLLNLAPDIQDELLRWQSSRHGRDRISERSLRPIVAEVNWQKQRQLWTHSKSS
jgi:hypothetical protein